MSATDFAREVSCRKGDLRYQPARLVLIVGSLPASIIFSPIVTLLAASAFLINPAKFGGFAVEDNGPGIEQENLEKVLEPFSQVDNRYDRSAGGTGLDLSLVEGLARPHNGRGWMESERNGGTKALFTFH
jgi:signal transduction histidine kinase